MGEVAEWLKAPQMRYTGNCVGGSNPFPLRHYEIDLTELL